MNKSKIIEFNKKNVFVAESKNGYGRGYFASRNIKKGETIFHGFGRVIDHQTEFLSVQIGEKKHFVPSYWTGKFWNHSCNPNTYIKTRNDSFPNWIALRNIKKGEEVNYEYFHTEYSWTKQAILHLISCKCDQKKCRGKIYSFSDLTPSEQKKVLKSGHISKYLLR